jgi:hypothetical protein
MPFFPSDFQLHEVSTFPETQTKYTNSVHKSFYRIRCSHPNFYSSIHTIIKAIFIKRSFFIPWRTAQYSRPSTPPPTPSVLYNSFFILNSVSLIPVTYLRIHLEYIL